MTVKTCNNCNRNRCKPEDRHTCSNHHPIILTVFLREVVTRVTVTNSKTTVATMALFLKYNY